MSILTRNSMPNALAKRRKTRYNGVKDMHRSLAIKRGLYRAYKAKRKVYKLDWSKI